jgi:outer membrane lipoprotein-sorting protein
LSIFIFLPYFASDISTREILDSLKAHQDQIKTIQADFAMTVFGVGQFKLDQSGTYTFTAPDQVVSSSRQKGNA